MVTKTLRIAVYCVGGLLFMVAGCQASDNEFIPPGEAPTIQATLSGDSPAVAVVTQQITETNTPPATSTSTATPTATPTITPTPTPKPMPIPLLVGPPYVYHTITAGETLGYLSQVYELTLEELVAMNQLSGPDALIQTGQLLRVPIEIENIAPDRQLFPDSEVVYGPSYVGFDIDAFIEQHGGYLASYQEYVDSELLSGGQIIERVAQQFSVGPRVLLALLEHYGGWVTNPTPSAEEIRLPLGPHNPRGGLYLAASWTANRINAGYYGYKRDGVWIFQLADRSRAITPTGLNAGTVGIQNILALHSNQAQWDQELGPTGLVGTYRTLFGDPAQFAIGSLVPENLTQPAMTLPWATGQGFYFTGGPHAAFVDGSAWAAVDFGPPDVLGNCFYSNEPNTAVADGVVVIAKEGEVQLDLDGDGNIQTGWVILYLHVALDLDAPVQPGQMVQEGDVIGYASCVGGLSNSSHLHFARRYNGEWMNAAGPVPLNLSGWVVQPGLVPYNGSMSKGNDVREPCECWEADLNLIVRE